MSLKPWREAIVPHPDVLEGTFLQSEFAADISAVKSGSAPREYQDASAFFERTFITDGMRLLLTSVARRLNGLGGDPVIQLQTAFGGGKTHTMLAVLHLANRSVPLSDLAGIPAILDKASLLDVPKARVAVLDGTKHSPGQPWKREELTVHTLWGELAWQLGGADAYALVKDADWTGTSPGKEVLETLLKTYAPCVVLVDELVAYVRQFEAGKQLSGGSYDSNLSFIQALTEALKLVPNGIMLASLPESEVEAGSGTGVAALRALETYFGRVQALWKTVSVEESFEIVRRRLFNSVSDEKNRDDVCRAFATTYVNGGTSLPAETQEARYMKRLVDAYPIHPEIFDRLFEDWATIDGFQRTRGVLKLMAKVIYRLWKDQNQDLLILPASLPLYDGDTRNDLVYHLQPGWDPVIQRDIDGERAETTELENKQPRFGAVQAARRVARTLFFGTAPSAVSTRQNTGRGLERARVLLGCLQPDQAPALYSDALNQLVDRLHYLNTSGDKTQETTRYWFDTRANLRREMEDRKRRFSDAHDVLPKIVDVLKRLTLTNSFFEGVHVATPHSDVPDDTGLRLVVLEPALFFSKSETRVAFDAVKEVLKQHGAQPRYRQNRLLFLAGDHDTLSRLRESVRGVLAWKSILEDVESGRLNIDRVQEKQARQEFKSAEDALPRIARENYKWLLCPGVEHPGSKDASIEAFALNPASQGLIPEIERVCTENELVISTWSPVHLRADLQKYYWKGDKIAVGAQAVWEDTCRYLYMPRLRKSDVFERAIRVGAATDDFFGTALGQSEEKFDGFKLGDGGVQLDETLLLIEPETAQAYREANKPKPSPVSTGALGGATITMDGISSFVRINEPSSGADQGQLPPPPQSPVTTTTTRAKTFIGMVEVNAASAKLKMVEIADEVISALVADPKATVSVRIEINAEFPEGAADGVRRAVSENASALKFKLKEWEE
jgi:predicted AAA+ superfamily ATPase